MRLLLHVCCGPCAAGALPALEERVPGARTEAFFYNPNIHPEGEYLRRRQTMQEAARALSLPLAVEGEEEEGMLDYLQQVAFREADRCRVCYAMRLFRTAEYAKEHDFEAFTTTLLISPYQNLEAIRVVGEAISRLQGPHFIYQDMRPFYKLSRRRAEELGLYRQSYCGCIFSEFDRLRAKVRRKAQKAQQTEQAAAQALPEPATFGFGLSRMDVLAEAPSMPMSRARPFTLAGLDPEATKELLASVSENAAG